MSTEPKDFKELVSWATGELIQAITSGRPLQSAVFDVLYYVHEEWKPAKATKEQP